jgi:uncharacterized membrane protein
MDPLSPRLAALAVTILFYLAIPVLIIALGVWIGLRLVRRNQPGVAPPTPMDILKMRYAKGEITQAEYEEMKKNL